MLGLVGLLFRFMLGLVASNRPRQATVWLLFPLTHRQQTSKPKRHTKRHTKRHAKQNIRQEVYFDRPVVLLEAATVQLPEALACSSSKGKGINKGGEGTSKAKGSIKLQWRSAYAPSGRVKGRVASVDRRAYCASNAGKAKPKGKGKAKGKAGAEDGAGDETAMHMQRFQLHVDPLLTELNEVRRGESMCPDPYPCPYEPPYRLLHAIVLVVRKPQHILCRQQPISNLSPIRHQLTTR